MKIDAHQHFWVYRAEEYPWIEKDWQVLKRDFLPHDLEGELRKAGLEHSVAVQARQSIEETRWLLQLAENSPIIKGVVGWVDLCSEKAGEQLTSFAAHPKFVAVRHVVQDEPDDRFVLRPEFLRGIGLLKDYRLAYDLLVFPKQLPAAIELVRRFPEQRFVLDHLGKPFIRTAVLSPWKENVQELAQFPNVFCKMSGLVTEAAWRAWKKEDFRPYLDVVFEAFGEDRLMFGSDWPVCLLSADYEDVFEIVDEYLGALSEETVRKIFGTNAARFYGLLEAIGA